MTLNLTDLEPSHPDESLIPEDEKELYAVLNCKDLDDFMRNYKRSAWARKTKAKTKGKFPKLAEKFNEWENFNKKFLESYVVPLPNRKLSQALLTTLSGNKLSFPTFAVSTATGLISLGAMSLVALGGAVTAAALVAGSVDFIAQSRENQKKVKKAEEKRAFLWFKNKCLNRVKEIENKNLNDEDAVPEGVLEKKRSRVPLLKNFFGATLMLIPLLFGSYYLASQGLLVAIGATAIAGAMVTPIGLAVAATVAIGVSIFLGYKKYQAAKDERVLKKFDDAFEENITTQASVLSKKKADESKHDAKTEIITTKTEIVAETKLTSNAATEQADAKMVSTQTDVELPNQEKNQIQGDEKSNQKDKNSDPAQIDVVDKTYAGTKSDLQVNSLFNNEQNAARTEANDAKIASEFAEPKSQTAHP